MRAPRGILVVGLLAVAVAAGGRAGWIHLKAELAQYLLARAWERVRDGAEQASPWPWADTSPLAELSVERLGRDLLVLGGASGRTLAFGPAHVAGSALPGELGNAVLTGHRDTHFGFLRLLRPGDRVDITDRFGRKSSYRVETAEVIRAEELLLSREAARKELTLVTCYPFDAVMPGGPLRYVVRAVGAQARAELAPWNDARRTSAETDEGEVGGVLQLSRRGAAAVAGSRSPGALAVAGLGPGW